MITHRFRTILGEVPADWESIPLRCCLSRLASGSWGADSGDQMVAVLRSTNFTSERRIEFLDVAHRGFSNEEAAKFDLRRNDVLLERSGGGPSQPVGRVVVADTDLPDHGFSNFVHLLRVDPQVMCPDFVGWCLYQLHRSGVIERLQHQTTQMRNLDFRDYSQIRLPRPAMAEQQAIADRIAATDHIARALDGQLDAVRAMRAALLHSLFHTGVIGRHGSYKEVTILRKSYEIPASWKFNRLGAYLSAVDYGTNSPSNDQVGWPVVAIPQVIEPMLRRGDWPLTHVSQSEADQLRLLEDDVLLIRTNGNPQYIGKSTVVPAEVAREHVVFASYLIRARPAPDLLGRYLNLFLASPIGRRQLVAIANTSAGNHNLGARALKRMLIPLPSLAEQAEIVAQVSAADELADAIRAKIGAAKILSAALLQNLLTGRVRIEEAAIA